jgi:hypothetical protein
MYKILSANIEPSTFGGTHTTWNVQVNGVKYYISYQPFLPDIYDSETMAFRYNKQGNIDWTEVVSNNIRSPDEAFVDIIRQLEAL